MSAPEIGQRATNGAEHAANLLFERQKILSSENQSTTAVSTVVVQTFPKQEGHEGYLLLMIDRHGAGHSSALIFEAATPERGPICEMRLPYKLRQGIHGTWVPAA
jgi:carotenoid cleavage dioxygenase-like enzyme